MIQSSLGDARFGTLRVWDLVDTARMTAGVCALLGLSDTPFSQSRNKRLPLAQIKMCRDFQRDHGVPVFEANKRLLLRKLSLQDSLYDPDRRFEDGLDLRDDEIDARFPDRMQGLNAALSMDGIARL